MWERLRRFRTLERPARTIFLRAAALLPLISLSLRLLSFQKTWNLLRRFLPPPDTQEDLSDHRAMLTARMVRAAVRNGITKSTCLEESLALWWLLGRQGITSDLRIGIRKIGEKLEAHAWIERDGKALNEPEARHEHYATFDADFSALPPGTP